MVAPPDAFLSIAILFIADIATWSVLDNSCLRAVRASRRLVCLWTGLAHRLAHVFQLHVEPSDMCGKPNLQLSKSAIKTRRRLIRSCSVVDSVPAAH